MNPVTELPAQPPSKPKRRWWLFALVALLLLSALTCVSCVLILATTQPYRVAGYAMEPTLHEQQYLLVNNMAYAFSEPQRGDIVVFEYPNSPETLYIKRVIAIPGDTIECRPNEIVINGKVIDEPYNPNPWNYTCPPITLEPNEYFVLGDNRSQSSDSHRWGPLEGHFIVGKAWYSYWPPNHRGWVPNDPIEAPDP